MTSRWDTGVAAFPDISYFYFNSGGPLGGIEIETIGGILPGRFMTQDAGGTSWTITPATVPERFSWAVLPIGVVSVAWLAFRRQKGFM